VNLRVSRNLEHERREVTERIFTPVGCGDHANATPQALTSEFTDPGPVRQSPSASFGHILSHSHDRHNPQPRRPAALELDNPAGF
jgi:hypothetical protein